MNNQEAIQFLKIAQTHISRNLGKVTLYNALDLAIKSLDDRPVGEWNTHHVAFHLTCPFCGCNIRALKNMVFEGDYNYNYCPNCGAYMKGVNAHD